MSINYSGQGIYQVTKHEVCGQPIHSIVWSGEEVSTVRARNLILIYMLVQEQRQTLSTESVQTWQTLGTLLVMVINIQTHGTGQLFLQFIHYNYRNYCILCICSVDNEST